MIPLRKVCSCRLFAFLDIEGTRLGKIDTSRSERKVGERVAVAKAVHWLNTMKQKHRSLRIDP